MYLHDYALIIPTVSTLACWWVRKPWGKSFGLLQIGPCLSPFSPPRYFQHKWSCLRRKRTVKRDVVEVLCLFIFLGCHFFFSILEPHSGSRGKRDFAGLWAPLLLRRDVTLRARCTCSVLLNSHRCVWIPQEPMPMGRVICKQSSKNSWLPGCVQLLCSCVCSSSLPLHCTYKTQSQMELIRISRWQQQNIKPSSGPL